MLTRTVTERSTRWPWDAQPVVQDIPGNWIADDAGCSRVEQPSGPPGGPPGAGSGGPDGGQCAPPSPPDGGGDGPGEGTCPAPSVGPGSGGGSSGGGGCFLTEAVVGQRGIEADDGATLTALRAFRDGYMQLTPERRALVERYYEIAPCIVAAIPRAHADWAWIGKRIDAAVAAIGAGNGDRAFAIYVDMVRRLEARWLEPAAGAVS